MQFCQLYASANIKVFRALVPLVIYYASIELSYQTYTKQFYLKKKEIGEFVIECVCK